MPLNRAVLVFTLLISYGLPLKNEAVQERGQCNDDTVPLSLSLLQNNIALKPIGTQTAANLEAQNGLSMVRTGYNPNPWATDVDKCLSTVISRLYTSNIACHNECGSVTGDDNQIKAYMSLASAPTVKNICETGFNRGHSSAMWLCANPSAHLYSFDLEFPAAALKVIQEVFGDRFSYFEGDSTETLAEFAADPSSPFCDIMVADGGHFGNVPWADLNNFAKISAQEPDRKHTLIMDEVYYLDGKQGPQACCVDVTKAFERAVSLNLFDTDRSYCQGANRTCSFEALDISCPVHKFPIVGEITLSSYHLGGYCFMSFAQDFLETI